MRLIDADLFKKGLEDEADSHGYDEWDFYDMGIYNTYMNAIELLDEQPTVEPEIIRCKECKRQDTDNVFRSMWCYEMRTFVKPNEFCSRAERRDDG